MIDEKDVAENLDAPIPEQAAEPQGEIIGEPPAPLQEPEPQAEKPKEQYVPLSRFNEVNQEMKELREQNIRMQTLIEERLKPPAPVQAPDPDDELIDPVVKQRFSKITQENSQLKQALGAIADKQDLLEARNVVKDYDKHSNQIDLLRRDMAARGQWVSRVDAYTYLQGKEMLGKPQAVKPRAEVPIDTRPEPIPATQPASANRVVKKPIEPGTKEYLEAYGHLPI